MKPSERIERLHRLHELERQMERDVWKQSFYAMLAFAVFCLINIAFWSAMGA